MTVRTVSLQLERSALSLSDSGLDITDAESDSTDSFQDAEPSDASSQIDAADSEQSSEAGVADGSDPDSGSHPSPDATADHGYCALKCQTALCARADHVCSSASGFCRVGCDDTRPVCEEGRTCDFTNRRCVFSDGRCNSDLGCGLPDLRLSTLCEVACEQGHCVLKTKPALAAVQLPSSSSVGSVGVSQPFAGERINVATLGDYRFRFDAGTPVVVAAILERPAMGVSDANAAAIWIAYVTSKTAQEGILLAHGDAVNGATSLMRDPRSGKTLYLVVFGYRDGVRRTQSAAIPFTIGEPYQKAGDPCSVSNELCPSTTPLVCVDGVCRAACLSDLDCREAGLACAPAGRRGITSGVCL